MIKLTVPIFSATFTTHAVIINTVDSCSERRNYLLFAILLYATFVLYLIALIGVFGDFFREDAGYVGSGGCNPEENAKPDASECETL